MSGLERRDFFRDPATAPSLLVADPALNSQLHYLWHRNIGFLSREVRDWWIHGIEIATLLTLSAPKVAWLAFFFALTGSFLRGFHNVSFFMSRNLGWDPKLYWPWVSLAHAVLLFLPLLALFVKSDLSNTGLLLWFFLIVRVLALLYENKVYLGTLPDAAVQRMFVPPRLSVAQACGAFVVGFVVVVVPGSLAMRSCVLVSMLALIRLLPSFYMAANPIPKWSKLFDQTREFQWGREAYTQILYFASVSVFLASLVTRSSGLGATEFRAFAFATIALRWAPRFYTAKAYEVTKMSLLGRLSVVRSTIRISDVFVIGVMFAMLAFRALHGFVWSELIPAWALVLSWVACVRALVLYQSPRGRVIESIGFILAAVVFFLGRKDILYDATQIGLFAIAIWNLYELIKPPVAVDQSEADPYATTSLLRQFEKSLHDKTSWTCWQLRIEPDVAKSKIEVLAHELAQKMGPTAKSEDYGRRIWVALPTEEVHLRGGATSFEKKLFCNFPTEIEGVECRIAVEQSQLEEFFSWNGSGVSAESFLAQMPDALKRQVEIVEYRDLRLVAKASQIRLGNFVDDYYVSLRQGRGRGHTLRRNRRWIVGTEVRTVVPLVVGRSHALFGIAPTAQTEAIAYMVTLAERRWDLRRTLAKGILESGWVVSGRNPSPG